MPSLASVVKFMLFDRPLAELAVDARALDDVERQIFAASGFPSASRAFTVNSNDSPATNTGRIVLRLKTKPCVAR